MFSFSPKTHHTATEAVISLLDQRGQLPETLTLHGSDGKTLVLTRNRWSKTLCGGLQLAWANRPSLNNDNFRWNPDTITIDIDVPQAVVDAYLADGIRRWNETMQQAYIECQVKRYANGIRDAETLAVLEMLREKKFVAVAKKLAQELEDADQIGPDY